MSGEDEEEQTLQSDDERTMSQKDRQTARREKVGRKDEEAFQCLQQLLIRIF